MAALAGDLKKMPNTSFNNGMNSFGASLAMFELTGPGHMEKTEKFFSPLGFSLRESSTENVVSRSL